jgi:hypothetical protein
MTTTRRRHMLNAHELLQNWAEFRGDSANILPVTVACSLTHLAKPNPGS